MCFLSRPSGSPEFIIDREGISMDPDRVKAVQGWPAPELVHDIHVFLGFANFYRRFLSCYSRIGSPITDLIKKTCTPFSWTEQADAIFERLNTTFSSAPILVRWNELLPDPSGTSLLQTRDYFTRATIRSVRVFLQQLECPIARQPSLCRYI
jgi:hypothetical protein